MEQQKEILQRTDDTHSSAASVSGHRSASVRDEWRRLLINLLVFAVTISALLRYSGGDLVLAGWSLSLFVVSYLFCCTCFFSTASSTPLAKTFIALSYIGLLAFFAGSLLSNVLGMVIMYLDSVLAAGMFGATLAQHRESNGTETAALVAVANARGVPDDLNKQGGYCFLGLLALGYAPRLVWLMLAHSPAIDVAVSLLGAIAFLQCIHITFVVGWLNGAVFKDDSSSVVLIWFSFVAFLFFGSYLIGGELVGVTVLWLCILASTAFLGYYLQIHASYEEIMSKRAHVTEVPQLKEILVVDESSLVR